MTQEQKQQVWATKTKLTEELAILPQGAQYKQLQKQLKEQIEVCNNQLVSDTFEFTTTAE